jgi:hypothetical protein
LLQNIDRCYNRSVKENRLELINFNGQFADSLINFARVSENTAAQIAQACTEYLAQFSDTSEKTPTLLGMFRKLQRELDAGVLNITLETLFQVGVVILFTFIADAKGNPSYISSLNWPDVHVELEKGRAGYRKKSLGELPIRTQSPKLEDNDFHVPWLEEITRADVVEEQALIERLQLLAKIFALDVDSLPSTLKRMLSMRATSIHLTDHVYAYLVISTLYYEDLIDELTKKAAAKEGILSSEEFLMAKNYLLAKLANQSYREVFYHLTLRFKQAEQRPEVLPENPVELLSAIYETQPRSVAQLSGKQLDRTYQGSFYAFAYGEKIRESLARSLSRLIDIPIVSECVSEFWSILTAAHNVNGVRIFQDKGTREPLLKTMRLLAKIQVASQSEKKATITTIQIKLLIAAVTTFKAFFVGYTQDPENPQIFTKSALRRINSFLTHFEEKLLPELENMVVEERSQTESVINRRTIYIPRLPKYERGAFASIETRINARYEMTETWLKTAFLPAPELITTIPEAELEKVTLTPSSIQTRMKMRVLSGRFETNKPTGLYTLGPSGLVPVNLDDLQEQSENARIQLRDAITGEAGVSEYYCKLRIMAPNGQLITKSSIPSTNYRSDEMWGREIDGIMKANATENFKTLRRIAPEHHKLPSGIIVPQSHITESKYAFLVHPHNFKTIRQVNLPLYFDATHAGTDNQGMPIGSLILTPVFIVTDAQLIAPLYPQEGLSWATFRELFNWNWSDITKGKGKIKTGTAFSRSIQGAILPVRGMPSAHLVPVGDVNNLFGDTSEFLQLESEITAESFRNLREYLEK